jgi:hypothetical protein
MKNMNDQLAHITQLLMTNLSHTNSTGAPTEGSGPSL